MPDISRKERILKAANTIPVPNLINFVTKGDVTIPDLESVGVNPAVLEAIRKQFEAQVDADWKQVTQIDSSAIEAKVTALNDYLKKHGDDSKYAVEAKGELVNMEDTYWRHVLANEPTSATLERFMQYFPYGSHIEECQEMLSDMPWLEAKSRNTVAAYEEYRCNYPGKHLDEINKAIAQIKDESDWAIACANRDYDTYLEKHPNGAHRDEAKKRKDYRGAEEMFLDELKEDRNKYTPFIIQQKVENNVTSWERLGTIFDQTELEAIKSWTQAADLPFPPAPQNLKEGLTEVYFWGLKSSGKTCALGAILSAATNIHRISRPLACSGAYYRDTLSNLFTLDGICTLPTGNPLTNNVSEMCIQMSEIPEPGDSERQIRKKQERYHQMTLIDLAGETITGIYRAANPDVFPNNPSEQLVNQVKTYLKNDNNNKVHFFIVEYGKSDGTIEGTTQGNILDNLAVYLENEKILRKSTVGVYVIVTKTDKIPCAKEDRPRMAYEYVQTQLGSFWQNLNIACKKAGISEPSTLSFSIGDVFAQNLCKYDGTDTTKIIKKILMKTHVKSWLDYLR